MSACRPTAQERRARTTRVLQRTSQVKDSGHRPMRVLLVEDNPGDARLLQESLSEAGDGAFELIHAGRLSEGLEYLCGSEFDIVLLDLSLPDSQGLETFSTTQATAPQVAIVVLTGLADDVLAAAALREGAQDYLVKGQVDPNLLARSIRYTAQRKRSEEALRESEERYRSLFENSMDAIFISGPDGGVIDANQAALDLFGFASGEALASGVGDRYADPRRPGPVPGRGGKDRVRKGLRGAAAEKGWHGRWTAC